MIYIGILTIYVNDKKFECWYHNHNRKHPGEIFVIIWTVLIIFLALAAFITGRPYHLPAAVVSSYIAVLTLLAITRKSKQTYKIHHRQKNKQNFLKRKTTTNMLDSKKIVEAEATFVSTYHNKKS